MTSRQVLGIVALRGRPRIMNLLCILVSAMSIYKVNNLMIEKSRTAFGLWF